jgi:hypothetical protein
VDQRLRDAGRDATVGRVQAKRHWARDGQVRARDVHRSQDGVGQLVVRILRYSNWHGLCGES